MRILVLGATGVAGRSTVPRLLGAGHHVRVHVRNPLKAQALRRAGVEVVWGDTGQLPDLSGWMRGCDAVFDFRISVPSAARSVLPGAWRQYAYLRDVMVSVLVDAALEAGVGRVVHDTAAMVYVGDPEAWLTEDAPVHATGALKANLAAEQHLGRFTAAGGIGVALRLGPLYGPDDVFSREVIAAARRGWSYAIGPAEGWTSALHTDDIGPAALAALRLPAGIYNVVDDEPLWRRELVALLARAVDRERLHRFPEWTVPLMSAPVRSLARSHRITAAKLRDLSGWQPTVPSRRAGWPAAVAGMAMSPRASHASCEERRRQFQPPLPPSSDALVRHRP